MIAKIGSQPERPKVRQEFIRKILKLSVCKSSFVSYSNAAGDKWGQVCFFFFPFNFNLRNQLLLFRSGVSMIQWRNSSDKGQSFCAPPQNPILASDLLQDLGSNAFEPDFHQPEAKRWRNENKVFFSWNLPQDKTFRVKVDQNLSISLMLKLPRTTLFKRLPQY